MDEKNYMESSLEYNSMFHGLPGFASSPPQRDWSNMKPRDYDTSASHNVTLDIV